MRRALKVIAVVALMALFGFGVNRWFAIHRSHLTTVATAKASATKPKFSLPGNIYISQGGSLYAINGGSITQLPLPNSGSWEQPAPLPDGSLLVVRRFQHYSDLYHISAGGEILAQLTDNANAKTLQLNHWTFWPSVAADGNTIFYSTDNPKPPLGTSYEVDFSVWSGTLGGKILGSRWSTPNNYTGGDIQPVPVPSGGIVYASYATNPAGGVYSVIGFQATPRSRMVPLTSNTTSCNAPALAPDGVTLAMICTADKQSVNLEVAHLLPDGTLSQPSVVVAGCLCNSPSWSPTGGDLLYMNAPDATSSFGLWWIKGAASGGSTPLRITDPSVDLDATSAAGWYIPPAPPATPSASASPTP